MVFMKCHRQYIEGGKVDKAGRRKIERTKTKRQTNKQTKTPRRKGLYRSNKQGQGVIGKRVYC